MRLIDADTFSEQYGSYYAEQGPENGFIGTVGELIVKQPTIEAKPIIHCKDCAFWESKRVSCEGLARCKTGESGYRCRFGHDFCSRAQRRGEIREDADDN